MSVLNKNSNKKTKIITSALIAMTIAVTSPMAMAKTTNVQFAKGTTSANYQGKIKGSNYDTYVFYAKKGQKLKITLTGGNVEPYLSHSQLSDSVNLAEYSPELDANGAYTLPYSGKYEMRILQPRSQANQGKTPKYWMKIAIR